jgi:hypothetical protein
LILTADPLYTEVVERKNGSFDREIITNSKEVPERTFLGATGATGDEGMRYSMVYEEATYLLTLSPLEITLCLRSGNFPLINSGNAEVDRIVNNEISVLKKEHESREAKREYFQKCTEMAIASGVPVEVALSIGNKRDIGNFKAMVANAATQGMYNLPEVMRLLEKSKTDPIVAQRFLEARHFFADTKKPCRLCEYIFYIFREEAEKAKQRELEAEALLQKKCKKLSQKTGVPVVICTLFGGNEGAIGDFVKSIESAVAEGFHKSPKTRRQLAAPSDAKYLLSYMKIYTEGVKDLGQICKYVADFFEEAAKATSEDQIA